MMRLRDYFPDGAIAIKNAARDWQQAIDFSMEALLKQHYITHEYTDAIKASTLNHGPYYILAPGVTMPHARPENGALKTGLSLVLLNHSVLFPAYDEPVKLLIGLSAANSDAHIGAIQALSELLCEEENINRLFTANSETQLRNIIAEA